MEIAGSLTPACLFQGSTLGSPEASLLSVKFHLLAKFLRIRPIQSHQYSKYSKFVNPIAFQEGGIGSHHPNSCKSHHIYKPKQNLVLSELWVVSQECGHPQFLLHVWPITNLYRATLEPRWVNWRTTTIVLFSLSSKSLCLEIANINLKVYNVLAFTFFVRQVFVGMQRQDAKCLKVQKAETAEVIASHSERYERTVTPPMKPDMNEPCPAPDLQELGHMSHKVDT